MTTKELIHDRKYSALQELMKIQDIEAFNIIMHHISVNNDMELLKAFSDNEYVISMINVSDIKSAISSGNYEIMVEFIRLRPTILNDQVEYMLSGSRHMDSNHTILSLLFDNFEKEIIDKTMDIFFSEHSKDILTYTLTYFDYDCLKIITDFISKTKFNADNRNLELQTCMFAKSNRNRATDNLHPILTCANLCKLQELKLLVTTGFDINARHHTGRDVLRYIIGSNGINFMEPKFHTGQAMLGPDKIKLSNEFSKPRLDMVKYVYGAGYDGGQFFSHYYNAIHFLLSLSLSNQHTIEEHNKTLSTITDIGHINELKQQNELIQSSLLENGEIITFLLMNGYRITSKFIDGHTIITEGHLFFLGSAKILPYITKDLLRLVFEKCNLTIISGRLGTTVLHLLLLNHNFLDYEDIIITKRINLKQHYGKKSYIAIVQEYAPLALDSFVTVLAKNYMHHLGHNNRLYNDDNIIYMEHMKKYLLDVGGNYNDVSITHIPRTVISIPQIKLIKRPVALIYTRIDIVIFCIFEIINKYHNANIPFLYRKQCIDLDAKNLSKSQLLLSITEMVFPSIILFSTDDNRDNFFHPRMALSLKNALKYGQRFIVWYILFNAAVGISSHAGLIIYDSYHNTIERFEPHGIEVNAKKIDDYIRSLMLSAFHEIGIDNITYIDPNTYSPPMSFQMLDEDDPKNIMDSRGYCAPWCFLYLELRLMNPNISQALLIRKAIEKMIRGAGSLLMFIRSYNRDLNELLEKFFIVTRQDYLHANDLEMYIVVEENLKQLMRQRLLEIQMNKKNAFTTSFL